MAAPAAIRDPRPIGLRVSLKPIPKFTDPKALRAELLLQCAPTDDFGPAYSWAYTDYETIGYGMRTKPGSAQLAVVTFQSLFVDADYPFVLWRGSVNDPANPVRLAAELKLVGDSMTPFQLLAGQDALWGIDYDVNMAVTLRSFQPVERAGEPDARYYTVSFTEFRGIPESVLQAGLAASAKTATGKSVRDIVLIRTLPTGRRTMRQLAKFYYGQPSAWRVIAKANGLGSVSGDVDLVARFKKDPTRRLTIPALAASTAVSTSGARPPSMV